MNNSNILTTLQLKLLCTLRNRHKTKSGQSGSDLYLNGKPLTENLMHPQPDTKYKIVTYLQLCNFNVKARDLVGSKNV